MNACPPSTAKAQPTLKHTYIDPEHSRFRFGDITARVEFSGDVHDQRGCDIQQWSFSLMHEDRQIDLTTAFAALDAAITDGGFPDLFRALHCPRAARDLSL